MSPAKLLHILPSYAPGGHRSRNALPAAGLGPDFTHCVVPLDGRAAGGVEPGIRLVPVASAPSRIIHLGNLRRLRRLLRQERPQVLITYNWGAMEAALANRLTDRVPHLHCEDGFSGPAASGPEPVRRALMRRLVLARSRVVVPSRGLAEIAADRWGLPRERIELIENGIDIARFARALREGRGAAQGLRIGTLSRLGAEKTLGLALRAFARLPDPVLELAIAGEGPERSALQGEAERLGISGRTRFLGHVGDPAAYLAGIDIYLMTSLTEQLPFSLLEAMAAGLPVVATDVGDVRQALAPPNRGLVARAGDEAGLAEGLARLVASAELRAEIGAANAERARSHFDQQRMIEAYRALLQRIAPTRLSSGG